jgi:hypothetical protein
MIPLWTSAIRPLRAMPEACPPFCSAPSSGPGPCEKCGCALCTTGAPWVAQRVWAMPVPLSMPSAATFALSSATRAVLRARRKRAALVDGHAARVVAPVFETAQPLDQDRDDVAGADRADDSTHGKLLGRCRHFRKSWMKYGFVLGTQTIELITPWMP